MFIIALLAAALSCFPAKHPPEDHLCKVMFYNVENLFDIYDDPLTDDGDFTPAGDLHWTYKRYQSKLNNLCKVIIALGGWQPPDIIGLCEVENRTVLLDLIHKTSLSKFNYDIVHEDSPDERGIDAAFLYNRDWVRVLKSNGLSLSHDGHHTRDILYVKVILQSDTCHVFVNHWPSRSAGQLETEKYRMAAAGLLRQVTDSIFRLSDDANIIIMGDFNDDPQDESLLKGLNALFPEELPQPRKIYNLTGAPASGPVMGTLKYQGTWNSFDQIMVSGNMLSGKGLCADKNAFVILQHSFLLEPDEVYHGQRPFRTYTGFRYRGGFSDHLPVYVEMKKIK